MMSDKIVMCEREESIISLKERISQVTQMHQQSMHRSIHSQRIRKKLRRIFFLCVRLRLGLWVPRPPTPLIRARAEDIGSKDCGYIQRGHFVGFVTHCDLGTELQ